MTFGGAASDAVKGLSGSPMLLLVAVLNVGMIFALLYVASSQRDERAVLTKFLIDCHARP